MRSGIVFERLTLARLTAEKGFSSWATPRASENENRQTKPSPSQLRGEHGMNLATQAVWATPTTQDAENCGSKSQQRRNSPPLNAQVIAFPPGQVESPTGMVLNPLFVEALMGFPDEWTGLDASEMQSFRKSRSSRGKRSASE